MASVGVVTSEGFGAVAHPVTASASSEIPAAPEDPAPEPSATALTGEPVSGRGPTESFPGVPFPIPSGARSLVLDFECTGGDSFSVELGDSMMLGQAPLTGSCDGVQELAWPVPGGTGSTLYVTIPEQVDWVASPRFSTAEFAVDAALAGECEAFSEVYSAFVNADVGYTHYDAFDAAEWATRVDEASAELGTLAEGSQTTLGDAFAQLRLIVSDPGRTVGEALTGTEDPIGRIHHSCATNHTPVITMAEFGG